MSGKTKNSIYFTEINIEMETFDPGLLLQACAPP